MVWAIGSQVAANASGTVTGLYRYKPHRRSPRIFLCALILVSLLTGQLDTVGAFFPCIFAVPNASSNVLAAANARQVPLRPQWRACALAQKRRHRVRGILTW
jgi:hypothetical protein